MHLFRLSYPGLVVLPFSCADCKLFSLCSIGWLLAQSRSTIQVACVLAMLVGYYPELCSAVQSSFSQRCLECRTHQSPYKCQCRKHRRCSAVRRRVRIGGISGRRNVRHCRMQNDAAENSSVFRMMCLNLKVVMVAKLNNWRQSSKQLVPSVWGSTA